MTEGPPLPPDLAALHEELSRRPHPHAPAALRARVLAAVRSELGARPRTGPLEFALVMAAAFLLVVNLTLSAAGHATRIQDPPARGDDATVALTLRELAPGISPAESRRQALLLRAGAHLLPIPAPRTLLTFADLESTNHGR